MGDPVSIIAITGAVLGTAGELVKGEQKARASEFDAEALQQQGVFAGQRAKVEEDRFRREARRERGSFRTAAGSSLALGGSAADIFEDAIVNQELDALNIRLQGALEQRALFTASQQAKRKAKDIRVETAFGIGTSLLKGAGAAAGGAGGGAAGGSIATSGAAF